MVFIPGKDSMRELHVRPNFLDRIVLSTLSSIDARLLDFQRDSSNIRAVTPTPDAPLETTDDENVNHSISSEDAAVSDAPLTTSNSFHFMQASELETPSGESAEWVSVEPPASEPEHATINGHVEPEAPLTASENPVRNSSS